jgi:hypothetical protein
MPSRSQRHKVIRDGYASNGEDVAEGAGNIGPAPTVTSLNPNTAAIGGAPVTLRVIGTLFDPNTVILFNNGIEPTTFVSDTEMTTGIDPNSFAVAGNFPVGAQRGSKKSNTLPFAITGTVPPITAINPDTATVAAAGMVGRTIVTLSAVGGTPPYDYTIGYIVGEPGIGKSGANLVSTSDPIATPGVYQVPIVGTDSRGQNLTENVAVTLT